MVAVELIRKKHRKVLRKIVLIRGGKLFQDSLKLQIFGLNFKDDFRSPLNYYKTSSSQDDSAGSHRRNSSDNLSTVAPPVRGLIDKFGRPFVMFRTWTSDTSLLLHDMTSSIMKVISSQRLL